MTTTVKRKPKTLRTFPSTAKINRRRSNEKAAATLAAMFPSEVHIYELTYTPSHMPQNATRANDRLRYFRCKIREAYRATGQTPPKMFWNSQYTKTTGWKHLIVIDGAPAANINVEMLWGYGIATRKDCNLAAVCRAIEATDRARGRRRWSYVRDSITQ